jgi:hypothetical protein
MAVPRWALLVVAGLQPGKGDGPFQPPSCKDVGLLITAHFQKGLFGIQEE